MSGEGPTEWGDVPGAKGSDAAASGGAPRTTPEGRAGPPSRIGRYEVIRLLGEGAMGRVFLARDPDLDRRVAIKTVRDDLPLPADARESFLARFRNEARAAARLSHPGIVAVFDVGDESPVGPYLVFEYVPGATLQDLLKSRGAFSASDVVRLAERIGQAIDAAHAAGIVHRDIKPQNILVAETGETKLTDFGVARVPDAQLTREGQFLGTPCYSAPETLRSGTYSPASDVFSFGATLYESITGARAFAGDDAVAVARKVVDDEPIPPSKVARNVLPAVDGAILRALDKDPSKRFASATALASELRRAYESAGASLPPPEPPSVSLAAPPRDASRVGAGAFVVILLGALIVGAAIVLKLGDSQATDGRGTGAATSDAGGRANLPSGLAFVAARHADAGERDEPETNERDARAAASPPSPAVREDAGSPALAPSSAGHDAGGLSRQEREELAKDEIDRARAFLRDRNLEAARAALARARALDPTHPDIATLEASVAAGDGP